MKKKKEDVDPSVASPSHAGARRLMNLARHLLVIAGAAALGLLMVASEAAAARFDLDSTPGRLSKDVLPTHYAINFDLDPARDTFTGQATIELRVRRPVSTIVLHAEELAASKVTLADESGAERDIVVTVERETSQWRLNWGSGEPLQPGLWRLRINYAGRIERRGLALFRVDYRTPGSESPRRMLATQLAPIQARAVFPAFDEPAFRATFDVAITAPASLEAVSNMPVSGQSVLADGRRRTEFARTPVMPTYLVALALGEFDVLTDSFDGVPLRILTAPGRSHEARYAMAVTKQVLGYYRDYFGIPYMLPKLDQLAVPGVRNGGMEDWGAISYNEDILLFDPQRSPAGQQELIFAFVAHEIAHQWFGNLVTAAWWDDIWLNEAFATWMAGKVREQLNPAWTAKLRIRLFREEAYAIDARGASRAVGDPPANETVINEVFDRITYFKGGAVLGMFEAQVGEAAFRDALRKYLTAHSYSNATADDLWHYLSAAAGTDLSQMIEGWIRQRGFPLLEVKTSCEEGATQVELQQHRFTSSNAKHLAAMWQVPVLIHGGSTTKRLVLGREPQRIEFPGCAAIVANAGDTGYYRVQYDSANMARLRAAYARLPATERMGLVADTMALSVSGRIDLSDYFRLLDAVRDEPNGTIWQQIVDSLTYLDDVLAKTPAQHVLRQYGRQLLGPVLLRTGWQQKPDEVPSTVRLRSALIDAMGRFDDRQTIARAAQLFSSSSTIDPSSRAGVVRTAARHADLDTFERLRRLLREAHNEEDRSLYGSALLLVRDPRLVYRVLQLSLTDEWPPGTATQYIRNIGAASGQPEMARDFILRNSDAVLRQASPITRPFLLPRAFSGFNDKREADNLLAVQRRLLGSDATGPAEQVAASIREKSMVREREENHLPALLRALNHRHTLQVAVPAQR